MFSLVNETLKRKFFLRKINFFFELLILPGQERGVCTPAVLFLYGAVP